MTERFKFKEFLLKLAEDAPTNNAGGGSVDGIGVGSNGEPGVNKKTVKIIRRNTRKWPRT